MKVKSYPLFITDNSKDLKAELQSYKWKTDRDGNIASDEAPVKENDHCFIGKTLIATDKGNRSLKSIREGDLVLTSKGLKKVLIKWNNGVQQVDKYKIGFGTDCVTLCCTPNHLIKTTRGWIQISELKLGMEIYLSNFSMGANTDYTQQKSILNVTDGICTKTFGSSITVQYQKVSTCITKTATDGITNYRTLNSKKRINTYRNTSKKGLPKILSLLSSFMQRGLKQQSNGTSHPKGLNGIGNMQKNVSLDKKEIGALPIVYNAEKSLIKTQVMQNSAIQIVKLKTLEKEGSWMENVYDLTVEDSHEYFANGILVHNCLDAMRYSVFTKLTKKSPTWTAF
jgi:hypothetical protein